MRHLGRTLVSVGALFLSALFFSGFASAQIIPDRNVNMVSGTEWPGGDPFLQRQNEPSLAVSTRNPMHLLAGTNDYRTVDLPGLEGIEVNADAWHGLFRSTDGGQTWRSSLLPGYRQDTTAAGVASPLKGFQAGADPVVRAGPNGMFFYSGIVLNRGTNAATAGFVARFIDNNDKEAGEPIRYLGTSIIAKGDSGQFIDKPWMAVDIPRGTGKCSVAGQTFDAFSVYVAYSVVMGPESDPRTKLMFTRSTDCGATWSAPTKLSESEPVNQGATIVIDPKIGTIYVVWRRVSRVQLPHAILYARSSDQGQTFSKAMVVASPIDPFDQGTTNASFRTLAFPTAAIDANGRVYVAWSERGHATGRDSRIMMAVSGDGLNWSSHFVAEPYAGRGHQLMPSLTFAEGKLTLIYYDLRDDSTVGEHTPVPQSGGLFIEARKPVGHLAEADPVPEHVFTEYLSDTAPAANVPYLRRHTLDVRVAQADPAPQPVFSGARLSQYTFGSRDKSRPIEQLQFNVPNFPLFRLGSAAFMGDYIDVAARPMIPAPGGWQFATQGSKAPVFGAVWTDNRDVRTPANKNWADYTPIRVPSMGTTSLFDGTTPVPPCQPGQAGMRNQNIYFAQITNGLVAGSPGNAKQVSAAWPRAFVVFVKNTTTAVAHYRLTIPAQPAAGEASFLETQMLTSLDASVPPRSTVARTVVVKGTDTRSRVAVKVEQITAPNGNLLPDGLASDVILNPDIANPDIANPDIANPDIANPDIANAEVFNPDIANPDIANPDIANPDIANPDIANPDIANPDIANPDIANPDIANPDIANPDIANPDIANPDIANPDIANASMVDTTWKLTNRGNTAAAYAVKLLLNGQVPQGIKTQLIIHRIYQTPVAVGCTLATAPTTVLLANIPDPEFSAAAANSTRRAAANSMPAWLKFDPADASEKNATLWLAPGDMARITLRVYDPDKNDNVVFDAAKAVSPLITAQASNASAAGGVAADPPIALVIAPLPVVDGLPRLPDAIAGGPYPGATLSAIGGVGALVWSDPAPSLPAGLTISPSGSISGTASVAGNYDAALVVRDSANPPNTKTLSARIRVVAPLALPAATLAAELNVPYSVSLTISGGAGPHSFSHSGGTLPPGITLSTNGTLAGTPTALGSYSFAVTVTDSTYPAPQMRTRTYALSVALPSGATLTFVTQPTNTISDTLMTPAVVARLEAGGVPIPGVTVMLGMSCPLGAAQDPWYEATDALGNATFAGISPINGAPQCFLHAYAGGKQATSDAFSVYGFANMGGIGGVRQDGATATLLLDGTILIAGGKGASAEFLNTADHYHPRERYWTWNFHPLMNSPRARHSATLLTDGRIVLAGGWSADGVVTSSIDIFDPATNTFSAAGPLQVARAEHSATLMADGSVLIAGGTNGTSALASVERFDPTTLTTALLAVTMPNPRSGHTALRLADGSLAMVGGGPAAVDVYTVGGTFASGGSLLTPRLDAAAVGLDSGKILVTGGNADVDGDGGPDAFSLSSAEIYDPVARTSVWTGSLNGARHLHTAWRLPDGTVVIAGGDLRDGNGTVELDTVELYEPGAGTFRPYGRLLIAKDQLAPVATPGDYGMFALMGGGVLDEEFYPLPLTAPLVNTTFDTDLTGWHLSGDMFDQQWSAIDSCTIQPCGTSGSITHGFGIGSEVARQRAPVTAGTKYAFRTALRSAPAQMLGMWGPVHLEFWTGIMPDGHCTGAMIDPEVYLFSNRLARADVWERDAAYGTVPAGAGCVAIVLTKTGTQLWFDDVFFATKPATP